MPHVRCVTSFAIGCTCMGITAQSLSDSDTAAVGLSFHVLEPIPSNIRELTRSLSQLEALGRAEHKNSPYTYGEFRIMHYGALILARTRNNENIESIEDRAWNALKETKRQGVSSNGFASVGISQIVESLVIQEEYCDAVKWQREYIVFAEVDAPGELLGCEELVTYLTKCDRIDEALAVAKANVKEQRTRPEHVAQLVNLLSLYEGRDEAKRVVDKQLIRFRDQIASARKRFENARVFVNPSEVSNIEKHHLYAVSRRYAQVVQDSNVERITQLEKQGFVDVTDQAVRFESTVAKENYQQLQYIARAFDKWCKQQDVVSEGT